MSRKRRKLTPAEKRAKAQRRAEFVTIFVNGKQKRVRRAPQIDGLPIDEFIAADADPIWLHQNDLWHLMPDATAGQPDRDTLGDDDGDVPF